MAPVGADVVIWLPFAHAGHWVPDLLIYGGPVVIGILAVRYADRRERRKEEEEEADGVERQDGAEG